MIKFTDLTFRYSLRSQAFEDVNFGNYPWHVNPGDWRFRKWEIHSAGDVLTLLVPHFSGGIIAGKIQVFGSDPIAEGVEVMAHKSVLCFRNPNLSSYLMSLKMKLHFR